MSRRQVLSSLRSRKSRTQGAAPAAPRPRIVVDAMNVIGTRPDGWWRDRPGAIRRLVGRLQALAASGEPRAITVVIDGRPLRGLPEGTHDGVEVLYAARAAANAADDRIVEYVHAHADPSLLEVVTSDRALVDRVRIHGATVTGPRELLAKLDALDGASLSNSNLQPPATRYR